MLLGMTKKKWEPTAEEKNASLDKLVAECPAHLAEVLELIAPINRHVARLRAFTRREMPRNSLPSRLTLPLLLGLYLEAAVTRLQEWPPDSGDAAAALPESVLAPPAGFRRLPEGAFIDDFLQRFLPEGLLSPMGGVGVG